jgi:hypothetical protein
MPLFCKTFTTWVNQQVVQPVKQYVNNLLQQCQKKKWWDPRTWICWFIVIVVEIIVLVVQYILVPVVQTICMLVSWLIFGITAPFGAAIDAVCQRCTAYDHLKDWFACSSIDSIKNPVPAGIGYEYTFRCKCNCINPQNKVITIYAKNDEEAADMAKAECGKLCI